MSQVEVEQLRLFETGPDLRKLREEAAALKRHTRSRATHIAYESDWRGFEAWCRETGRAPLPCTSETLTLYITAELNAGRKISSAQRYIAAVSWRHEQDGLPVPDRKDSRLILQGTKRKRKEQPRQRAALTPEMVRKICDDLIRTGGMKSIRDHALLTLGFATGLRRSNLVALNLLDVQFCDQGVRVMIRSSKTDQSGRGQLIGVFRGNRESTCPVRALQTWLRFRGEAHGPLFCRIEQSGRAATHRRLVPNTVNRLVKKWVKEIGIDPTEYGGHSLRAGFVTTAGNAGSNALLIMQTTGHRSVEMVQRYIRNADPFAGGNPLGQAL